MKEVIIVRDKNVEHRIVILLIIKYHFQDCTFYLIVSISA